MDSWPYEVTISYAGCEHRPPSQVSFSDDNLPDALFAAIRADGLPRLDQLIAAMALCFRDEAGIAHLPSEPPDRDEWWDGQKTAWSELVEAAGRVIDGWEEFDEKNAPADDEADENGIDGYGSSVN